VKQFLVSAKSRAENLKSLSDYLSQKNEANVRNIILALREQRKLQPLLQQSQSPNVDVPLETLASDDPLSLIDALINKGSISCEIAGLLTSARQILHSHLDSCAREGDVTPPSHLYGGEESISSMSVEPVDFNSDPNHSPAQGPCAQESVLASDGGDLIPQFSPPMIQVPSDSAFGLDLLETPCIDAPSGENKRIRLSQKTPGAQTVYGSSPMDESAPGSENHLQGTPPVVDDQQGTPPVADQSATQPPPVATSEQAVLSASEFPVLSGSSPASRSKSKR